MGNIWEVAHTKNMKLTEKQKEDLLKIAEMLENELTVLEVKPKERKYFGEQLVTISNYNDYRIKVIIKKYPDTNKKALDISW